MGGRGGGGGRSVGRVWEMEEEGRRHMGGGGGREGGREENGEVSIGGRGRRG